MKQKKIEKILKNESERFAPDPIDKIKTTARAQNLLPRQTDDGRAAFRQGKTAVAAKAKGKRVAVFFASFAAIAVCLVLALTFTLRYFGKNKPHSPLPSRITLSANDVYGMGAVSSVKLLGSSLSANAVMTFSALNSRQDDNAQDKAKSQAKKFNEYFTALDSFLGEDIVKTTVTANPDANYDYQTKMTIYGKDMAGNFVPYTMYYTETLVKADADEEETGNEYRLVGVMVIDGVDYTVEGERSEESEKDESETELNIRAYAKSDRMSYIQMEQEYSIENGETETEYVYSVYSNGVLVEQTAVEFETEQKHNKVETAYELEFRNGDAKGKYSIEREQKDGKTSIKVKYNIDNKSGVFHIREIIGENSKRQYEYTFDDDQTMIFG